MAATPKCRRPRGDGRPGRRQGDTKRDRIDQLRAEIEAGVADLVAGEGWQHWLAVAARFPRSGTGAGGVLELRECLSVEMGPVSAATRICRLARPIANRPVTDTSPRSVPSLRTRSPRREGAYPSICVRSGSLRSRRGGRSKFCRTASGMVPNDRWQPNRAACSPRAPQNSARWHKRDWPGGRCLCSAAGSALAP
jgi:hypothetical protein